MRVSVIIPALNEGDRLEKALATIPREAEIIVVDGGSRDETVSIAHNNGVTVLETDKAQRSRQMNLGAELASGEILLFLHADTQLPEDAVSLLTQKMENPLITGGCFARRFQHPSIFLSATTRLAGIRAKVWGWMLGDQVIFVRKCVFKKLGGFQEWDSFEDLDFSRRMRKYGKTVVMAKPVISSGRRFLRRGPIMQTIRDIKMTYEYVKGNHLRND